MGLVSPEVSDSLPVGPRVRHKLPDVSSEADIHQLLDGLIPGPCPERDRVVLELLYGARLRAAELAGVNLADIQDKRVLLVRGKGKQSGDFATVITAAHELLESFSDPRRVFGDPFFSPSSGPHWQTLAPQRRR
jgi:site-specific recombinase XerC